MDEQRAVVLAFVISVLAGITVAIVIAFAKKQFPEVAGEL